MCLKHKKVFTSEQKLYTRKQLTHHMKYGDDDGIQRGSKAGKGHPVCKFCSIPHFDADHLYQHLTYQHYQVYLYPLFPTLFEVNSNLSLQCHLCQSNGPDYEYFNTYNDLEQHFRRHHYLCEEPMCLEKKFVVFENTVLLKVLTQNPFLSFPLLFLKNFIL